MIRVRNRAGRWLQSPWVFPATPGRPQNEAWMWTGNEESAHHFKDRAEAKAVLRRLGPDVVLKEISFHKLT